MIKETAPPELKLALHEPVEFISKHLVDKLEWSKGKKSVAVHVPCSSKKMGIENAFLKLAQKCADEVRRERKTREGAGSKQGGGTQWAGRGHRERLPQWDFHRQDREFAVRRGGSPSGGEFTVRRGR
eukprot:917365-Prorocentrum_minimum.AAC.1